MGLVKVAFSGAYRFIMSGKIITYLYNFFMTLKNIASIALITARNVMRFALSWNGLFLALDILILFGDKIPVIKESLSNLGSAFTGAFAQLGKIGQAIGPAFAHIQLGLASLRRNQDEAFTMIGEGVSNIVDIIKTQLWNAWASFVTSIKDEIAFVYRTFMSIYEVIMNIVNAMFQVGSAMNFLPQVASDAGESIRSQMGEIAKTILKGIGDMIEGLGMATLALYETAFTGLSSMMSILLNAVMAVMGIFRTLINQMPSTLVSDDAKKSMKSKLSEVMIQTNVVQKGLPGVVLDMQKNVNKAKMGLMEGSQTFRDRIDDIFAQDFEIQLEEIPKLKVDVLAYDIDAQSIIDWEGLMPIQEAISSATDTLRIAKDGFVGATTGSFGATRNALFKASSKEDKQIDLLTEIAASNKQIAGAF
jgi:hypothetical protein